MKFRKWTYAAAVCTALLAAAACSAEPTDADEGSAAATEATEAELESPLMALDEDLDEGEQVPDGMPRIVAWGVQKPKDGVPGALIAYGAPAHEGAEATPVAVVWRDAAGEARGLVASPGLTDDGAPAAWAYVANQLAELQGVETADAGDVAATGAVSRTRRERRQLFWKRFGCHLGNVGAALLYIPIAPVSAVMVAVGASAFLVGAAGVVGTIVVPCVIPGILLGDKDDPNPWRVAPFRGSGLTGAEKLFCAPTVLFWGLAAAGDKIGTPGLDLWKVPRKLRRDCSQIR